MENNNEVEAKHWYAKDNLNEFLRIDISFIDNPNVNKKEIKKLCDKCFENMETFYNFDQIITYIRTIYRDLEEKKLHINCSYSDDDKHRCIDMYINNKSLTYFFLTEKIDKNTELSMECGEEQFKFEIYKDKKRINLFNTDKYDVYIRNALKEMRSYENIEITELNNEHKVINDIYKLFYNQSPDFSDDNIELRVQAMLSILSHFGITLGDKYSFVNLPLFDKEPFSHNLSLLVKDLKPYGKIDDLVENIELKDSVKKIIRIVSENINSYVNEERDLDNVLVSLSTLLHAKHYNLPSVDCEALSRYLGKSYGEVESKMKLIKTIKNNIKDQGGKNE